jgi:hypothetical protein
MSRQDCPPREQLENHDYCETDWLGANSISELSIISFYDK